MDNLAKIACCNICLLSQAMKDCKACPFNPSSLDLKPDEIKTVARVELLKQEQLKP